MVVAVRGVVKSGIEILHRPGTTDENIITEVIDNQCYRKPTIGFAVCHGEHWLDLGANIGAFAVYCRIVGASADCYEPMPECVKLLRYNSKPFKVVQACVTSLTDPTVTIWPHFRSGNHARATTVPSDRQGKCTPIKIPNVWAGSITTPYDGVKMDIEGSEMGILDARLLPPCHKLVLEYHSSRDQSATRLRTRLAYLRSVFDVVSYPPELDRIVEGGKDVKTYFDRLIFCMRNKVGGRMCSSRHTSPRHVS